MAVEMDQVVLRTGAKTLGAVAAQWHKVMGSVDVPLQVVAVFSYIAAQPGPETPQQHLAQALGMSEASVSRNLSLLAGGRSALLPGPGLVQSREDPDYRRRRLVSMTPKGRAFLAELVRVMGGQHV